MVVDGPGVPLGVHRDSASPAEVTLLEPTWATIAVPRAGSGRPRQKPERVIADQAYDSDPLRQRLAQRGIELSVPHRRNRKKPPTQDGANCAATVDAGKSSARASRPDSEIFAGWWCAGNDT